MGTTAEKLTYLGVTKEKIRDSINLTGANIGTSDTFRSYATKLKKGYIDIINNGIDTLYNNFPKVSGIGSNLSLTPTYEAPMKLNEIQGDTLQDGTPTPDTPVEIQSVTGLQNINVCGKNLVSFNDLQTSNNTSYTWQNDILQISATTGTYNRAYKDITDLYKNNPSKKLRFDFTSYDFSQGNDAKIQLQIVSNGITSYETLVETSGTINTRTIPSDTSSITQVLLRLVSNNTSTSQASQISITKPILHFGSSATEYEPYKGNTYEVNLGKNLFDINGTFTGNLIKYNNGFQLIKNSTNRTINYLPSSPIPKGTYTLSYEIVSSTLSDITKCIVQTFNSSNTPIATKQFSNDGYVTFTTTGDITKIYFYISNAETDDTQITLDNIQLEKGTQSTSFSPYFTPIELNKIGTYKDSIKKSTGKNLFDKDNTNSINAYINGNTMKFTSSGTVKTYYITCKPNTTYTIQKILSNQFRVGTSSDIPVIDGSILQFWQNNSATQHTITTDANAKYLCICIYNSSSDTLTEQEILDSIMIEENNQATTYEPYGKVWYVEKQIGKVVLDGTENGWSYNDANAVFIIPDLVDYLRDGFIPYSNLLQGQNISAYNQLSANSISFLRSTTQNRIVIKNTNYTGVTAFKNWLNSNNVTVYYVLATPTYTEITNTELIEDLETLYTAKSQEGTTNISITSEDLEMILNVSALKGEV